MTPYVLTVDAGLKDLREADHLLQALAAGLDLPEGSFGCTHLVRDERPRVALSLAVESGEALLSARRQLTEAGYEVSEGAPDEVGRAVLYPGAAHLTGTVSVAELLSRSAIARVTVLGTTQPPSAQTAVVTRDHVRPQWLDGELVLAVQPAAGGTLTPFEVPDPTPCCADH
ncbi:hypothetical protein ACIP2X_30825 [Streptomyces sp. NPDC089424]|uniref:hypothetical protein n=1 Tax=Streptomyces sp. NPDC089424 TaxID=3365917 RepID=UPI00381AB6D1